METPLVINLHPLTEYVLGPDTSSVLHILYSLHSHSDPDMDTTMITPYSVSVREEPESSPHLCPPSPFPGRVGGGGNLTDHISVLILC